MKTFYKFLLLGGVVLLMLSPLISNNLKAQPLVKNNHYSASTVEMGMINSDEDNRPNKLILIYDSTSLTFEFTEDGELALISTSQPSYLYSSGGKSSSKASSNLILTENYINTIMKKAISENVDEEEDMELQDWMIHPEGWLEK